MEYCNNDLGLVHNAKSVNAIDPDGKYLQANILKNKGLLLFAVFEHGI